MVGLPAIFVEANTWINVFAAAPQAVGQETDVQSDPANSGPMELSWGGDEPSPGPPFGLLLKPGQADFATASACWVRFEGRGGLVRLLVRE